MGNPYAVAPHTLLLPKGLQQRPTSAKTDIAAHSSLKHSRVRSAKPLKPDGAKRPDWDHRAPQWERKIPEYDAWRDPSCARFFDSAAASARAHDKLRAVREASLTALRDATRANNTGGRARPTSAPATRGAPPPPPARAEQRKPYVDTMLRPTSAVSRASASVYDEPVAAVPAAAPAGASATVRRIELLFDELVQRAGLEGAQPLLEASSVAGALRQLAARALSLIHI